MKRQAFLDFLTSNGCLILRTDPKGYSVARNVINLKMSGIPKNDPLRPATVCRICKTLGIHPPEEVMAANAVIEFAHREHNHDGAGA